MPPTTSWAASSARSSSRSGPELLTGAALTAVTHLFYRRSPACVSQLRRVTLYLSLNEWVIFQFVRVMKCAKNRPKLSSLVLLVIGEPVTIP